MKWSQLSQEKRLSKEAIITLVNHTVYQFGNSLSLIFINLYLWRLTNSLLINGLFNLIAILTQALTTLLVGKFAKKKDRLTIYRYGILLTAVFYIFIVIVRENIVTYFYWFALMKGISQSSYWLGYFTLVYDVSDDGNRHRYLGWNQISMSSANLIGPAAAGAMISMFTGLSGYIFVFSIAFVMFVFAAIGSFKMKEMPSHHTRYYMKYVPQMIKKEPAFIQTLLGWLIIGFPQGILMYVPSILLYTIFNQESTVGYLNVIFLSLSILSSYIISRWADIKSSYLYLLIAGIGFTLSSFVLLGEIAAWSVILFMAFMNIFKPLQGNTYAAYYFQWIDRLPLKEHFRVESVVLRETITNLGRGLGIVFFMVFSKEIDLGSIPWILVSVMGLQLIIPFFVKNEKKTFQANLKMKEEAR